VIFKKIPKEAPKPGEDLVVESRPLKVGELEKDSFLIKILYLSPDPYLRGRMRDPSIKSYAPPLHVGEFISGLGIGEVIKSKNDMFPVGSIVYSSSMPWEEYDLVKPDEAKNFEILHQAKESGLPLSYYLGVLGMPGLTAYVGLNRIGQPKPGETIFISAASGAVGQLVGQLAKLKGLRVTGIASEDEKVKYLLNDLKFDDAFNYKKGDLEENLKKVCPDGINIYWENVGGPILDAVLKNCAIHARIVACGMISQYNKADPYGVKNLIEVVARRIRMEGFIVGDYAHEYKNQFYKDVTQWLKEGKIKYKEDIAEGLDKAADALLDVLEGRNFGKKIIKLADPSTHSSSK